MSNPYEERARLAKAEKLATFIMEVLHHDLETVDRYQEKSWELAATAAGVNNPSPATRVLVRDLIRARLEARKAGTR